MDNAPGQEAKVEERRRPSLREENLPGHLENQQGQKAKPAQPQSEESLANDPQLKRALELLKGWDVFKQVVQRKAA